MALSKLLENIRKTAGRCYNILMLIVTLQVHEKQNLSETITHADYDSLSSAARSRKLMPSIWSCWFPSMYRNTMWQRALDGSFGAHSSS
jgi:hypothetical protein